MNVILDTKSNDHFYLLIIDDAEPLKISKFNTLEAVEALIKTQLVNCNGGTYERR